MVIHRQTTTERDIVSYLNSGMLEAARSAAQSNDYEEAFENILAVLALEPNNRAALILLVVTMQTFILLAPIRSWLSSDDSDIRDAASSVKRFAESNNANTLTLGGVAFHDEQKKALLRLARLGLPRER